MTEDTFVNKFAESWELLEEFNKKLAGRPVSKLPSAELKAFAESFREASHNLAYAKTHFPGGKTAVYLNQLVGAAHNSFYVREKSGLSEVLAYFSGGFPALFRKNLKFIIAAFLLFVLPGVIFAALVFHDKSLAGYFFSEAALDSIDLSENAGVFGFGMGSLQSSLILTNNIKVCVTAFAFGIFFGLGTVYILAFNGALIGALWAGLTINGQSQLAFWALILPHGVTELCAIFISGAAGLMLGAALIRPGGLSRKHALIKAAKSAAGFIPGLCVMLVFAGLIEGFFTPLAISPWVKLLVSALTLAALSLYFGFAGRRKAA